MRVRVRVRERVRERMHVRVVHGRWGRSARPSAAGATAARRGGRCAICDSGAPHRAWRTVVGRWWLAAAADRGPRRGRARIRTVRLVGRDRSALHRLWRVTGRRERHHRRHTLAARVPADGRRRHDGRGGEGRGRACGGGDGDGGCAATENERLELVHARPELVELGPGDILLPGNAAATETGHGRGDRARFDQRVRV